MFIHQYSFLVLGTILLGSITMPSLAAETVSEEGAELYHDYCSVCHGDKGDGNSRAKGGLNTRPRDFTQQDLSKILTRESMVDVVLNGRPGTAMAGWGTRLSLSQAESVIDYVRNTFMSTGKKKEVDISKTGTMKTRQTATEILMPYKLTGSFKKGKLFYEDNCATCHGVSGAGDGPRAYFIFPKPRNFLSPNSRTRLNRSVLFHAIKYGIRGKEMPAWGKVLNDQQIANITEYVFKAMIQMDNNNQTGK